MSASAAPLTFTSGHTVRLPANSAFKTLSKSLYVPSLLHFGSPRPEKRYFTLAFVNYNLLKSFLGVLLVACAEAGRNVATMVVAAHLAFLAAKYANCFYFRAFHLENFDEFALDSTVDVFTVPSMALIDLGILLMTKGILEPDKLVYFALPHVATSLLILLKTGRKPALIFSIPVFGFLESLQLVIATRGFARGGNREFWRKTMAGYLWAAGAAGGVAKAGGIVILVVLALWALNVRVVSPFGRKAFWLGICGAAFAVFELYMAENLVNFVVDLLGEGGFGPSAPELVDPPPNARATGLAFLAVNGGFLALGVAGLVGLGRPRATVQEAKPQAVLVKLDLRRRSGMTRVGADYFKKEPATNPHRTSTTQEPLSASTLQEPLLPSATQGPLDPPPIVPSTCILCFDHPVESINLPCGHGSLCKRCCVGWAMNSRGNCSICKASVRQVLIGDFDDGELVVEEILVIN